MSKSSVKNAFSSRKAIMWNKAVENQNDDFNIKMNMIAVKMIGKWKAVTLRRSIQKHSIEADKRSESFLLE